VGGKNPDSRFFETDWERKEKKGGRSKRNRHSLIVPKKGKTETGAKGKALATGAQMPASGKRGFRCVQAGEPPPHGTSPGPPPVRKKRCLKGDRGGS